MDKYNSAKNKILKEHDDSNIVASFELKDGYIFSLKPKSFKQDEYVLDGFFKVSNSGEITEYSTVMDPKEFREALSNRIE